MTDRQHHQQQDILNFEANIGLTTTLFDEKEGEEKKVEGKEEEEERAEKEKEESIMTTTTYKIGGVELAFDNATPTQTRRL